MRPERDFSGRGWLFRGADVCRKARISGGMGRYQSEERVIVESGERSAPFRRGDGLGKRREGSEKLLVCLLCRRVDGVSVVSFAARMREMLFLGVRLGWKGPCRTVGERRSESRSRSVEEQPG